MTTAAAREPTDAAPPDARPQLLFIGSMTSGSSRRVEGFLAQVLQRRGNHDTFRLRKLDSNEHGELLARLTVREVPTLLVVHDRRVVGRLSRPSGCAAIHDFLSPWLK